MAIDADISSALSALDNLGATVQQAAPDFLAEIGERFCDEARATKTFTDQTGRLSASIGYGIVVGGSIVRTGGFGGGEGEAEGLATLQRAASEADGSTPTLIVVAGMHYAIYVERKGYAVLDGARFKLPDIAEEVSTKRLLELLS